MAASEAVIRAAAERLRRAAETGIPTGPVRDDLPPGDVAAAYAIQKVNTDQALAAGRRLVGRKVDLTSEVVQTVKLGGLDLRVAGMIMERRGDQISLGAGAACLGNPFNAALWLARTMVAVGAPLKAGDIVMAGAATAAEPLRAGLHVEAEVQHMGRVAFDIRP